MARNSAGIDIALLSASLVACGDLRVDTDSFGKPDTAAPVTPSAGQQASFDCSPLDGRYTFSYSELDGGCGPWANDTLDFDQGRLEHDSTNGCSEGQVAMSNACVLQIDSVCVAPIDLGFPDAVTQYVTGSISELRDNRAATGTVQVVFMYASGRHCTGHYLVSANRRS